MQNIAFPEVGQWGKHSAIGTEPNEARFNATCQLLSADGCVPNADCFYTCSRASPKATLSSIFFLLR
jgi:hypothetical protein